MQKNSSYDIVNFFLKNFESDYLEYKDIVIFYSSL